MTQTLLWLNIPVFVFSGLLFLWNKKYLLATALLFVALLSATGLCYVDLQTLIHPERLLDYRKIGLLLEVCVTFGLYYYTKTIFRDNSVIFRGVGFWLSLIFALMLSAFCVVDPAENLFFSPDFADEGIVYLTKTGFGVYLGLMLYLVFDLVQLERTLAGLHRLHRWSIKPEIVASGLLIASYALYSYIVIPHA